MSRRLHGVVALSALLTGCSLAPSHPSAPGSPFPVSRVETIDSVALAYVRVVLALGERDPDSLDFAVVSSDLRQTIHRSYPTYEAIDRETSRLLKLLTTIPLTNQQQLRAHFLQRQLQAVHTRILMLEGHTLDFTSEARDLFQTQPLPDTEANLREAARRRVSSLLPVHIALPPHTLITPSVRYAAYDRRFLIPPDHLAAVMTAALQACRRQTLTYIALPPGESVDLTFVRNQPWSAFSRFEGHAHSTISLNVGFPITVDQALELACHEGYPGHHVFNTLRDIALVEQNHWPEDGVQPTFSPQSYLSESAAAFAPRLAFTLAERIAVERDTLFPLAGLPRKDAERYVTISALVRTLASAEPRIAQEYLDGQLEFVRAAQRLQHETLMDRSEATLLYLNEFRSYMLAYTDGPHRIATAVGMTRDPRDPSDPAEDLRRSEWQAYTNLIRSLTLDLPPAPQTGSEAAMPVPGLVNAQHSACL